MISIQCSTGIIDPNPNIINLNNYIFKNSRLTIDEINKRKEHYKSASYYSMFDNVSTSLLSHDLYMKKDNHESTFNEKSLISMLQNKSLTVLGDSTSLQMMESLERDLSSFLIPHPFHSSDGIYIRSFYAMEYNFTLNFCLNRRFNYFHKHYKYEYTEYEHDMDDMSYKHKMDLRTQCTDFGMNQANYIIIGVGAHYKPGYRAHGVVNQDLEAQIIALNKTCMKIIVYTYISIPMQIAGCILILNLHTFI